MLDRLFNSHIDSLQNALSRTTKRQTVLMGNLANVNVPGYKRRDLDFHVALAGEMNASNAPGMGGDNGEPVTDQSSLRLDGNNVDLEREVSSITETEMHFQALTDLTANYFSALKNVIHEGK